MGPVAIIFGATGLVGVELTKLLLTSESNWKVYGVARRPEIRPCRNPKYKFISCDLLDKIDTQQKLSPLRDVTHIFWITWAGQNYADSRLQNKEMLSNALDSILPNVNSLQHVSLQTGMNHYVSARGPGDSQEQGQQVVYYTEDCPRVSGGTTFYYVLEDLIKERLTGVPWSVIRPGLIMGCSRRSVYNFIGSLSVYGALCKHLSLPFVFGGSRICWEEPYIDGSDARLVAQQHAWAATEEGISSVHGQSYNSINGPRFTWKEMWPLLGEKFGVEVVKEEMFDEDLWYSKALCEKGKEWDEIVVDKGLVGTKMEDLADWGFLDGLFRCPKILGSREKADRDGFKVAYQTSESILYWVDVMREEKLVP